MNKRIFVVDDDSTVRTYLFSFLSLLGYSVECFESGERMLSRMSSGQAPAHLLLLDVLMPESDGIELLETVRASGSRIPVIMLSGVAHIGTVVESMKMGALDFLLKPFDEEVLESTVKIALEVPESSAGPSPSAAVADTAVEDSGFVTCSPAMLRLRDIIKRVAFTDVPILILGESGVGKEVMARYAHERSGRKHQPFVKVNCAALPDDLLESELFGYDRGAFTGAVNDKPGKFELAHGGTLLLDEIGEMSPHLQSKLLHVLQDGAFSRLGARKSIRVDTRIIASTNIDLEDAIATGKFRADLYYRLNVIRVDLPPLRERTEDIPQLCDFYVKKYRSQYKSALQEFPRELLQSFVRHPWPGNIRQLENVIKRFLILGDADQILDELAPEAGPSSRDIQSSEEMSLLHVGANAADEAQRSLVLRTLAETGGNRKKAAARLNICYKALLNKLKRWEVEGKTASRAHAAGR